MPETKATHIVMDHTGDTRHEFDTSDPDGLAEAEKRFKELTGSGFIAAETGEDGQHTQVRHFNPEAKQTLFIPKLKGG